MAVVVFVVGAALGSGSAHAHCTATGTGTSSASVYGLEFNYNYGTCNNDTEYTGRFEDSHSDGYRVQMRYKMTTTASWQYSVVSNGQGIDYQWYYDDSDTTAYFQICRTNLSGTLIDCASQGTDRNH